MTLVEHARLALEENYRLTEHYAFSVEGLVPDPAILSHVKRVLKKQSYNPADAVAEDDKYLDYVRQGKGRYESARLASIDPIRILRRIRVDEDFKDRVAVAEAESLEKIVAKVRELAEDGEKWAALKMLESKNPEEYDFNPKNKGININIGIGQIGGGISNDHIVQEIKALEAEIRQQRELRGGMPMLELEEADVWEE
jgi:hypothetical protein